MEGVRLSDEMEEAIRELPPADATLFPSGGAADADGDQAILVAAFKGGTAISDALKLTGMPPFKFYPLAAAAVKQGLLGGQTEAARAVDLLRSIRAAIEAL